jgi:excisionase family DNA binding protein
VDLDVLVPEWLTVPDAAERLGVDVTRVRAMIKEHALVAVRRGERGVLSIPALLLDGSVPVKGLRGTLVMLADFGYSDEEMVRWLFAPEDVLGGLSPAAALQDNRPTAVHKAAQLRAI